MQWWCCLASARAVASLWPQKGVVLKNHPWLVGSIFVHLHVFSFICIVLCDPRSILQAMFCSTHLEMDVRCGLGKLSRTAPPSLILLFELCSPKHKGRRKITCPAWPAVDVLSGIGFIDSKAALSELFCSPLKQGAVEETSVAVGVPPCASTASGLRRQAADLALQSGVKNVWEPLWERGFLVRQGEGQPGKVQCFVLG